MRNQRAGRCQDGDGKAASAVLVGSGIALAVGYFMADRVTVPKGVLPVNDFHAQEYMGHWYEIARIDHRFERGMTSTTAQYKLLDDGIVSIVNRGFDPARGTWKQSHAKARFLGDSSVGSLKVSFFWPFQGGYNVVYVDADYSTAVVIGDDVKYFWILSRSPDMDDATYDRLLEVGRSNGVDVRQVLRVPHGAGVR